MKTVDRVIHAACYWEFHLALNVWEPGLEFSDLSYWLTLEEANSILESIIKEEENGVG